MFSIRQKREISEAVQKILRATKHPELPEVEIKFSLHVEGKENWSWADIQNNGSVINPDVNPWNEKQDHTFVCQKCGRDYNRTGSSYVPPLKCADCGGEVI